jgi:hypothetical protein
MPISGAAVLKTSWVGAGPAPQLQTPGVTQALQVLLHSWPDSHAPCAPGGSHTSAPPTWPSPHGGGAVVVVVEVVVVVVVGQVSAS